MPPLAPCHSSKGNTYCLEAAMATGTMWKDAGDSLWDILPITVLVMSAIKKEPRHWFRDQEKKKQCHPTYAAHSVIGWVSCSSQDATLVNSLPYSSILPSAVEVDLSFDVMCMSSVMSNSLWPHGVAQRAPHGIFQARTLEWAAISFSRRSSRPRDGTWVSCVSWLASGFFATEPHGKRSLLGHG